MPDPDIQEKRDNIQLHIDMLDAWIKSVNDDKSIHAQNIATDYTVVAVYGIIEFEMKRKINEFIDNNYSKHRAKNLKKKYLKRYQWHYGYILEVLDALRKNWVVCIEATLDERQKIAISTMHLNRSKIAHGEPFPTSFSEAQVQFQDSMDGLLLIADIIK